MTDATFKASTIPEFCEQHRLSRALFYELLKAGRAPPSRALFYELLKAGRAPRVTSISAQRRVIFEEDAAAWRRAMAEHAGPSAA
jgi:predicted DNA-binding transcriptional regulator AlpA